MTSKTKRVLTEISKYKVHKLHETYLKEEFPCIYRKFLLRQVRQNTFSLRVENVKSKGGEGLCQRNSIAFLVSGCREPIGNQSGTNFGLYRYVTRTNVSFFDPSPNDQRTEHSCA